MNEQEQIQQAFFQWLAEKSGAKSEKEFKSVLQSLKEDDLKKLYTQFIQEQQSAVQTARQGARLNYVNQLNGKCPRGTHLSYYKAGGIVCKKCEADIHNEDKDPIKAFKQKCGGKVVRKNEGGEMLDDDKKKSKLVKKPVPIIKNPTPKPNNTVKRPTPKDLKELPNGKYLPYWNAHQRGQQNRDHDEGV